MDSERKKTLHFVPGFGKTGNGISRAAELVAGSGGILVDAAEARRPGAIGDDVGEVWVHSMWTPAVWRACEAAIAAGKPLVRMPHGCLDPVRLSYHAFRKRLVFPVEHRLFARARRVVATCPEGREWIRAWGVKGEIEIIDLAGFFALRVPPPRLAAKRPLHLLYLGRRHPLKGIGYLEKAARMVDGVQLEIVSGASGGELEEAWARCDTLVLPTLSENFGLVVAEALERGKRVITTDGAPAWRGREGVAFIEGYRSAPASRRVELLAAAIRAEAKGETTKTK